MDEELMNKDWDVIVVGGGTAGLSAALTLGRSLRRVVVIDADRPRNRFASHMHAVLGNEGADPAALLARGREEAAGYGVRFVDDTAIGATTGERAVTVSTRRGELTGRALIVATGLTDQLPDVPGLAKHWGATVLHCPYCHGWEVQGQRIGVLGSSPMSLHQVQLVRQWTGQLTFFTAGCGDIEPELAARLRARGVKLIDTAVTEVISDGERLSGVLLDDGTTVALDAIFSAPAGRPHDEFLADLGLGRTESPAGSFLAVDQTGRTTHPRIWAIGNVANPAANVPMSIGAGALTGGTVNTTLVAEDFDDSGADHDSTGDAPDEATESWESRYSSKARAWSGHVNDAVADIVTDLPAGDALDVGCGEGGDAVWMAEQGWQVTAIDISATAIRRGAAEASAHNVADRITWLDRDLTTWQTRQTFDLVTASFFHSHIELPRTEILRRAAEQVRPGGHLLIISHAFESDEDIPPWAWRHDPGHDQSRDSVLLSPAEEVSELNLDPSLWKTELQQIRPRYATGPDGQRTAWVKDGIVLLTRT